VDDDGRAMVAPDVPGMEARGDATAPVSARIRAAWHALERAQTVPEVVSVLRGAEVLREYVKQAKLGLRAQNEAAQLKIEAMAKVGEMLDEPDARQERGRPAEKTLDGLTFLPTLEDLGVSRFESWYWRKVAAVPKREREAFYALVAANVDLAEAALSDDVRPEPLEVTTAGLLRYHAMNVHRTSAEDEWLTPRDVVERVVAVLGSIDLDPCSNSEGEPSVPADVRYVEADDGLAQPWSGRVYMNPPYGVTIGAWTAKLREEYADGNVSEAIALVPARTDTDWWRDLNDAVICFVRGRLRFSGSANSAPFPSALAYFGDRRDAFVAGVGDLGDIWVRVEV